MITFSSTRSSHVAHLLFAVKTAYFNAYRLTGGMIDLGEKGGEKSLQFDQAWTPFSAA